MLTEPSIILVTGIMASGKSTVAQLLSERFEKSVYLRGDIFRKMIVKNRKEVEPGIGEDEMDQLRLRYRLAAHSADAYYQAGFTVVVQDVVIGPMLSDFISYIQSRPFYVVLRDETPRIGLWLDTSELTPEETVNEILTRLQDDALLT